MRIGRIAGVDIIIGPTLIALFMGIILGNVIAGKFTRGVWEVSVTAGIFTCVLIHEFAHIFAGRRVGMNASKIRLIFIGGLACLDENPKNPKQELVMAIGGPTASAVLGVTFLGLAFAVPGTVGKGLGFLSYANFLMAGFNLLPLFPSDGGRIFRSLLWRGLDKLTATYIAVRAGQFLAAILGVGAVVFTRNPYFILLAGFIMFAGQEEWKTTKIECIKELLRKNHAERLAELMKPHDKSVA